jgi:DMSO/TMAO reductase YedYZ molybdopterin-dependent catalytic subunit
MKILYRFICDVLQYLRYPAFTMKKSLLTFAVTILCFLTIAKAQTACVKIGGEVTIPMTLNDDDIHKYAQTTVTRKDHDGKDHTYTGVILSEILKKAGVTLGPELKGKNLTKYVLITATDNYQVVFALAELDEAFTDRTIILADQVDGKPLPSGEGPFRIIVQDEKKPARCIRAVTNIKVITAK